MMGRLRQGGSLQGSVPAIVVFVIVISVGARLMYLSVQHHTALAHAAAVSVCADFAAKIQPRLVALANLAAQQAALAPEGHAPPPSRSRIEATPPADHAFWMAADDSVLRAPPGADTLAQGIAGEFRSAESSRALPATAMLGPMRLGSQWIVAARVPARPRGDGDRAGVAGWAVAYADLEVLIADSHLGRLVDQGYDFQLLQILPRGLPPRVFVGSLVEPLTDAVSARVTLPVAAIPGTYLELAVQPHSGWYPVALLAADVGMIAFLAWLLAFGTHDLGHALQRYRTALAMARRRLQSLNEQLAAEIRQRVNLQENFSHALFHDAFTGLPNRRYFMDRLDRALREVRTKQRPRIAVAIVDITRFKLVNNLLGHTAGDELMVQAARRFEKSAGGSEGVLARWGGDQFALLILKLESTAEALNIGALLREELRLPFQLRRHQLAVAASVGLSCTDSGQQRAEDVVREADIALSVAKHSEGSKVVLYAHDMSGHAATLVSLEADLHIALEKRQMQLLLQPVVDLRTYRMVGAEALLRWRHPVESVLAPDRFLRIAEDGGLMVPITRWVILRVLKIAADWRRRLTNGQSFYISINLSPTALRDPGLAEYVGTLLRETAIPPAFIKFEITETALLNDVAVARETLEQLHALGVGLMLDDFGTGFSSLSNLQLFPFDFVKIERPFVNLDDADQANTGMMTAMLQMTSSLKLTAIAEAIETEAAATALQQMGCEYGQGYYFSKPVEAEMALRRLNSQEPFQPSEAPRTVVPGTVVPGTVVPRSASGGTAAGPDAADASVTQIVAPLPDPSATLIVASIDDLEATRVLPLIADPDARITPGAPAEGTAALNAQPPPEDEVPADHSPTVALPPIDVRKPPPDTTQPITRRRDAR